MFRDDREATTRHSSPVAEERLEIPAQRSAAPSVADSCSADESDDSSDETFTSRSAPRNPGRGTGPFHAEPEISLKKLGFYEKFPPNFILIEKFAKFADDRRIHNIGAAIRFLRKLYSVVGIDHPVAADEAPLFVPELYKETMEILKNLVEGKKMAASTGNFAKVPEISKCAP